MLSTGETETLRRHPVHDIAGVSVEPPQARAGEHLRIRLFNVKFSPNLGDGLLSECLESALITLGAHWDTWSIDLAARRAYGDGLTGRRQILSALETMPAWLRQTVVRLPLALQAHQKWRPHFAESLEQAQAVVIGGGNLISDLDLNFPTKLTLAISEAEKRSIPIAVYASGVTSAWSSRGTAMMRDAFASPQLRAVFVRDEDSKVFWDEKLGEASGRQAIVVRDPGLLASEFIPPKEVKAARRPVAGVGIMAHIAIRYHSDRAPAPGYLERWYVELVQELIDNGFDVAVFTNGSPEDIAYLEKLRPALELLGGDAVSFPRQRTPAGLCGIISGFNVVIAYRMHAIIAAYSYGVPAVALAWDRKLQSFMASVGRQAWLRDVTEIDPAAAAQLACKAAAEGIPDADRTQVLREAWEGVAQLLEVLECRP